jgi:hypothetical protein
MSETIQAYPLQWPVGWKRSATNLRATNGSWKGSVDKYRRELLDELRRLNASDVIISTNIPLRKDGMFYADWRMPADPGVAVYFKRKGKPVCFACDKYSRIEWNVHAIGLTIQAMRQIERCGASDMMDRAFTGFAALPETTERPWRVVFDFEGTPSLPRVEQRFRELAILRHPDRGGSEAAMAELNRARDQARAELGAK